MGKRFLLIILLMGVAGFAGFKILKKNVNPQDAVFAPTINEMLALEGISHEPENPGGSVAVINGAFLHEGQRFEGYEVLKVDATTVRVMGIDNQKEHTLHLSGSRTAVGMTPAEKWARENIQQDGAQTPDQGPASGAVSQQELADALAQGTMPQAGAMGSVQEQLLKQAANGEGAPKLNFNPAALLGKAMDTAALADLRKLHVAAEIYYAEQGGYGDELSIATLVKQRLISPAFASGVKGGYRFSVRQSGDGTSVSVSPVSGNANSSHYLIDEWGDMHVSKGSPATENSPLYRGF